MEVTNAYNSFFTQQTRLMHYETEILPIAQEVLEKSKRSFEEGKSNILVPISAQQAYINSRLGYLQTLGELQNAISDLERATGAAL
jgi:outer membrane protein TolC